MRHILVALKFLKLGFHLYVNLTYIYRHTKFLLKSLGEEMLQFFLNHWI